LRDSHSLFCSSARSNQLLHTRLTLAPVRNVSFPRDGRSTSAPPTRMRLFPVRRPLNRNRRHCRLESRGRDQQRARTTLISEPERRRAGDTLSSGLGRQANEKLKSPYVLGYLTWVPSETGASYGDLDPQYLTASYRVYLNEPDAKRVFAYIKKLQASSPVWNAEISNCTAFIGSIANFLGLKVPSRWQRPEDYVNGLKAMNDGRQIVHLSSEQ
jgi:hypothetical protein